MLRFSEQTGQDVQSSDGQLLGRVEDLTVAHGADRPEVQRLLVRRGGQEFAVPWRSVDAFDTSGVSLRTTVTEFAETAREVALEPGELRIGRDVLDAQIIDLDGHRLVRAGDVLLARLDDAQLVVVGVDVGFGSVVRRLGLRRVARRWPEQIVAWGSLHLTSRRGHEVQLESSTGHLQRLTPDELVLLLRQLSVGHAGDVLLRSPLADRVAALAASHDEVGGRLLASIPETDARQLLAALPSERAHALRHLLARTNSPRRRYRRTKGWRRQVSGTAAATFTPGGTVPPDGTPR